MKPTSLEMSREEMKDLGYRVVDLLAEHLDGLRDKPASGGKTRDELEGIFWEPPPAGPGDPAAVLERLERDLIPRFIKNNHPRFFAFVPSPSNFVGAMADALVAGLTPFLGTWFAGSGPAEIELVTLDWLRQICGLPEEAGGLFLSGGSMANLTALGAARHVHLEERGIPIADGTAYFSDQTHSSVEKALGVLGIRPDRLRKIPSDGDYRLPIPELRAALAADRAAGLVPFCVIANAGTTNTGAIDPLEELADLCREEGLWLHADGAYGAAAAVCERGRRELGGLGRVDSLSLDPHKWLFQPIECGCVLVRDRRLLRDTYAIHPEYLQDVHRLREAVNFADYGIQLTRGFKALKLWMTIQVFGMDGLAAAVERGFELAEVSEAILREPGPWRVVTPARMAIVNFRWEAPGKSEEELDEIQLLIVERIKAGGLAIVTSTQLQGRTVLRLCTINPRTTEEDLRMTIEEMARLGGELAGVS